MSPGGWRPRTSSRKKRKGSGVTSRRRAQGADTARPSLALAPPSSRKLLLNLLPPEKSKWPAALAARRAQYAQFCAEMIRFPDEPGGPNALDAAVGEGLLARTPTEDHPLATKAGSKWKAFFADAEIREQIDRDVMRTHPDMHFFSSPEGEAVENRAQMKRALFVYAKLNPGIRYVQGMNEVYAPLYWAFRISPDRDSHDNAEADEIEDRGEIVDVALDEGNDERQQQRDHQDRAIGQIGHEALHRAKVECRQHEGDQALVPAPDRQALRGPWMWHGEAPCTEWKSR